MSHKSVAETVGLTLQMTSEGLPRLLNPRSHGKIAAIQKAFQSVLAVVEELDAARQAHGEDKNLSGPGVQAADAAAGKAALAALHEWLKTHREPVAAQIATLTAPVAPPPTDPTRAVLHELRQQEVRRSTAHLDLLERDLVFLTADDDMKDALATAPPVPVRLRDSLSLQPFVSQRLVDAHRASQIDPEKGVELRDAEAIASLYENAAAIAKGAIRDSIPGITEDPA